MIDIKELLKTILKENRDRRKETYPIDDNTRLLGGVLDSLGFIIYTIEVEERLRDVGISVVVASDKAFSSDNTPFRTIETLAEFIAEEKE